MKSYSEKIFNALDLDIFKIISDTADKLEFKTYIVGGFVRDIILNRSVKKDIDIMCVGSGIDLAKSTLSEETVTTFLRLNLVAQIKDTSSISCNAVPPNKVP